MKLFDNNHNHPEYLEKKEEHKKEEHGFTDPIKWNFTKFLFDENGKFLTVFFNRDRLIPDNPDAKGKEAYEKLLSYLK